MLDSTMARSSASSPRESHVTLLPRTRDRRAHDTQDQRQPSPGVPQRPIQHAREGDHADHAATRPTSPDVECRLASGSQCDRWQRPGGAPTGAATTPSRHVTAGKAPTVTHLGVHSSGFGAPLPAAHEAPRERHPEPVVAQRRGPPASSQRAHASALRYRTGRPHGPTAPGGASSVPGCAWPGTIS